MKSKVSTIYFILLLPIVLGAQIGGQQTYSFLQLSPTARITALGSNLITVKDDDVALAAQNPGLLNAGMNNALSFNHSFYLAKIQHGYFGYGRNIKKWGITAHGGIQYIRYGTFQSADEYGNITGSFKAAEYAIGLGAGKQLSEHLSLGVNLKCVTSQFEGYHSLGIVSDIGAVYYDSSKRFLATLVFRNAGSQLSTYEGEREPLPFDVQIGVSKKLRYLPFRFSVIAHHLQQWNIRYSDANADSPTTFLGEQQSGPSQTSIAIDNFFRHFIFSGEFLFGKRENFRLRIAYNHLRRKELSVANYRSLAGFSGGVGIKINRFRLDYGIAVYHLAGTVNHIGISTDIDDFRGKIK